MKPTKAFLAGTFDNFHVGHQWLLAQAKKSADFLVIVIARDKTVTRIKKNPPKNPENQRLARIQTENLPNTTIRLGRADADFWTTLAEETPDMILLGYDQKFCTKTCQEKFPDLQIIRLEPYAPEVFKSSKF